MPILLPPVNPVFFSLRITCTFSFFLSLLRTNGFVDNASTKPFVLKKERKKENVHVIRSEKNTGFTGGNNIGMQYALDHGADYILIINNDTIADQDLLKNLLEVLN